MTEDSKLCWYHGKIPRISAEELLQREGNIDGTFLVRESNSSTGDFVLSVLWQGEVVHYQIRRHTQDAFFSIEEQTKIHGLDSLIEFYQGNAHVLDTKLTVPCRGEPPPHNSRRHGPTNLLHRATKEGNYKVVSELLKSGYRLDAKNNDGQTAVHIASLQGKDDILQKLIQKGANVNSIDTAGYTPLHYACQKNFPSTVRLLIQVGKANIQARNTETGWVPLHEAASRGYKDVVQVLLSLNAPINPRTIANDLPSELARSNEHWDCAEMLEKYKTPTPKTHRDGWCHGTLGRDEAISLIRKYSIEDGTFLVRYSDRNEGSYVLTMFKDGQPFHYIIQKQGPYLFIDGGPYFKSLEQVIDYYSFIADGLPTILCNPVPPQPKPPVPEFSTIPRQKHKTLAAFRKTAQTKFTTRSSEDLLHDGTLNNISFTSPASVGTNNNYDSSENEDYIPAERLQLGQIIGEGEFGSVYKGIYSNKNGDKLEVAIKTLHNEHVEANRGAFLSEAQVMMKLNHHCVVKLIGISKGPPLQMVQELVFLGSLFAYLIQNKDRLNPNYELIIWAAQIACGMKYLEEQRFVHRDLAARNILLASRHQAKISDFGLSRALGTDHNYYRAHTGGKWPLRWYAPESYNFGTFSHASDVWSFGILLWEMYTFGEQPYGDRKGTEAIKAIEAGERLAQPEKCPDHIYHIMSQCWAYNAENRPSFSDLLVIFSNDTDYINIKELVTESNLS